jgi:uncharacterized protein YjiS (DUF1127 family)
MTDIDWAGLVSAITGFLMALTGAIKLWRMQREGKTQPKAIENEDE